MNARVRLLSALMSVALVTTGLASVARADASEEAQFVALINQSRAAAGLAPLTATDELIPDARNHTAAMIAQGGIFHSSNAELSSYATGWSIMGENVGKGPTPNILHQAFMNSPEHKANILGNYNYVGVGADRSPDGALYVTVLFMLKNPVTTTTTAPPATTVPTTTPTTAPPVTTATPTPTTTTLPPAAAPAAAPAPAARAGSIADLLQEAAAPVACDDSTALVLCWY